ncbi:energy-coupling factor ABC transporter permease [Endothiovibrio diazotrophicus]
MPDGLLPIEWIGMALLIYLYLMYRAIRHAPWKRMLEPATFNTFLGACVVLLVIWSMRAGISPGMSFHYLGMTTLTLMFGWQMALIGASLVLFGITLNGGAGWHTFPVNILLMGAVPILFSHWLRGQLERRLPLNFFIYVLGNGFFGAGLAVALSATVTVLVLLLSGTYPMSRLSYEYLPFFPLMMVPEGFLNGMVTAVLVGFRPEWVHTFDDRRYIAGK